MQSLISASIGTSVTIGIFQEAEHEGKTFWIELVAVFVLMHASGFALHQVWLDETYNGLANAFRAEAKIMDMMWMIMVCSVLNLFLFCYFFATGCDGKCIGKGAGFGLLMSIFVSVAASVDIFLVYSLSGSLAVNCSIAGVICCVIASAVFAAQCKLSTA